MTIKWGKVSDADGYDIFIRKCNGKKFSGKPTKTVKGSSTSIRIRKLNGKKINSAKNYKIQVKAWRIVDGKKIYIASSLVLHIAGNKNKVYTNAKKVTVKKSSLVMKKGKTVKIAAAMKKSNSRRKILNHVAKYRYWSTKTNVAKVSAKGKITAKGKGTCYIYVMAANGAKTKIKVTVK